MGTQSFQERWDWLLSGLVIKERYIHETLLMMRKEFAHIPTMCVHIDDASVLHLSVSKRFVERLTDPEVRAVLKHECLHILLGHCSSRKSKAGYDQGVWDDALELAVNSLIPESPDFKLPEGAITPALFKLPPKLSADQYVLLLKDRKRKNEPPPDHQHTDDHSKFEDNELVQAHVRELLDQMKADSHLWGSMSADVKVAILAAHASKIPWWRKLRQHYGMYMGSKKVSTLSRPHRRYGYPFPGTRTSMDDAALIGIDDSGSIGDEELAIFLGETNVLQEQKPLWLQVFDSALQGPMVRYSKRHKTFDFTGRGGTDFGPLMELAEKKRFKTLIILTDGCAPAPKRPEGVKDILWCIIGEHNKPPVDWGDVIHVHHVKQIKGV
jgi:predicted metal-dependent peptidase